MWTLGLLPLVVAMVAGALAWHHATSVDRQARHESWARQTEPNGALGLAVGALVAAVAAGTVVQLMFLPRIVQ
jgi:hypothetical protein